MGGEKEQHQYQPSVELGSPPRGRGKARTSRVSSSSRGITPAWAGKRWMRSPPSGSSRDHPRVGGEKQLGYRRAGGLLGSPPRGRGKDSAAYSTYLTNRITPAWAGKSLKDIGGGRKSWDHPRVGGEKNPPPDDKAGEGGSPPRGRGKATAEYQAAMDTGITPAWAGKSAGESAYHAGLQDHPRVGGEKLASRPSKRPVWGSPPRGRGKALTVCRRLSSLGITPAWAGKRGCCR